MFDQDDRRGFGAIDINQRSAPDVAHYHQPRRARDEPFDHAPLRLARFGENGVQRDNQRRCDAIDQFEDQVARRPSEDAEFMLEPDRRRGAAIDRRCSGSIGGGVVVVDRAGDRRVAGLRTQGTHRVDIDREICARRHEMIVDIGGEGRDSALARPEATDQRDPLSRLRRQFCGDSVEEIVA